MKNKTLKARVELGERSYEVLMGDGIIEHAARNLPVSLIQNSSKSAFIIADKKVKTVSAKLKTSLKSSGWNVTECWVNAGEELKSIDSIYPIYEKLLKAKADRHAVLFAVGGGSVGDAAGFVAATYLRGISWIGVPTTLLSQVDSAIGGKTGINHAVGKNLIGAFHQPAQVICDIQTLSTLSDREMVSGFGEIIKYGIAFDSEFFSFLKNNLERFENCETEAFLKSIERSAYWKCKTVSKDEFDRKGEREVLNFGHTFGHAIESLTQYKTFQHGEAVIWGMRFALALSVIRKHLKASEYAEIDSFLRSLAIPPLPKSLISKAGFSKIISKMMNDKKVRNQKIHFVLLKKLGQTVSDPNVTLRELELAFELMMKETVVL